MFICVDTKVAEMNIGLEKLADYVRKDPELLVLFCKHELKTALLLNQTPAGQEFMSKLNEFFPKSMVIVKPKILH